MPIGSIYYEQLVGSKGFDGPASLLYHIRRPTSIIKTKPMHRVVIERDPDETLLMRHFLTHSLDARGSLTLDRKATLFNNDVTLWISQPTKLDRSITVMLTQTKLSTSPRAPERSNRNWAHCRSSRAIMLSCRVGWPIASALTNRRHKC